MPGHCDSILPLLSRIGHAVADLLAPPRCAACDDPVAGLTAFCATCDAESPALPPESLGQGLLLVPARPYAGPAGRAVRKLKFGGRAELALPLGVLVAGALERAGLSGIDRLVPVPLHPARLAGRGYNQAALIARHTARSLGTRAELRGLERRRATLEQASLDRTARVDNVSGAFASRAALRDLRVVVVDDVVTTGSTAAACADALRRGGASVVAVACVARALAASDARAHREDRRATGD